VYDGRVAKPREIEPTEEVNATKLNDMKGALDNLRIVNVAKKPAGVAADLRGEKLQEATLQALQRRGFFASQTSGTDSYELYAMNGDLQVTLKDGVQYLLRFGNGAGASFEPVETEETKEGEAPKEVSINRFLLVTTRLDESKFPPPDLERVPETVEELKAMEAAKKAALQPAVPVEPMPTEPTAAEPAATEPAATEPAGTESANTDPAQPAGDTPAEEKPAGDEPTKDPVAQSREAKGSARLVSFQDPAPPAELSEDEWKERLEAERERITKENQRKIDQRNDRMAVAKKRVAELNARFADWYYIVSDSEFKRLKIELADLITKKGVGLPAPPSSGLPGSVPGFNIPGLSDQ
jgi:PHD/YefM family antitoxin component YafN of YafNO toxin-antitoxin module